VGDLDWDITKNNSRGRTARHASGPKKPFYSFKWCTKSCRCLNAWTRSLL